MSFPSVRTMNSGDFSDCGLQRLARGPVAQLRSLSRARSTISKAPSPAEAQSDEFRPFVDRHLEAIKPLPPITLLNLPGRVIWFNVIVITTTPLLSLYGIFTTRAVAQTVLFSIAFYVWNMLGNIFYSDHYVS